MNQEWEVYWNNFGVPFVQPQKSGTSWVDLEICWPVEGGSRVPRDPTPTVRILRQSSRLSKVRHSRSSITRPLFQPRSLVLSSERGDPCLRWHSKGLPEEFDEGARLSVADLCRNGFYRMPCNQQLDSFRQAHLPSPKLKTRPNFSAESSLDSPDAYTDFFTKRIQRWSPCLVCDEGFRDSKRPGILREPYECGNCRGVPQLGQDEIPECTVKVICSSQPPDSYRLDYKLAEKRGDVQHPADLRGTWEKASP
jgi:hypothetical protein